MGWIKGRCDQSHFMPSRNIRGESHAAQKTKNEMCLHSGDSSMTECTSHEYGLSSHRYLLPYRRGASSSSSEDRSRSSSYCSCYENSKGMSTEDSERNLRYQTRSSNQHSSFSVSSAELSCSRGESSKRKKIDGKLKALDYSGRWFANPSCAFSRRSNALQPISSARLASLGQNSPYREESDKKIARRVTEALKRHGICFRQFLQGQEMKTKQKSKANRSDLAKVPAHDSKDKRKESCKCDHDSHPVPSTTSPNGNLYMSPRSTQKLPFQQHPIKKVSSCPKDIGFTTAPTFVSTGDGKDLENFYEKVESDAPQVPPATPPYIVLGGDHTKEYGSRSTTELPVNSTIEVRGYTTAKLVAHSGYHSLFSQRQSGSSKGTQTVAADSPANFLLTNLTSSHGVCDKSVLQGVEERPSKMDKSQQYSFPFYTDPVRLAGVLDVQPLLFTVPPPNPSACYPRKTIDETNSGLGPLLSTIYDKDKPPSGLPQHCTQKATAPIREAPPRRRKYYESSSENMKRALQWF